MKIKNWESMLAKFIQSHKNTPFAWGEHDCCLFAANAVKLITGIDYADRFRGKYTTQLGSVRALKRYGKGGIKETLDEVMGEPIPRLQCSRGDVVLIMLEQPTLGIYYNGVWAPGLNGVVTFESPEVLCCWRCQ